MKIFESRVRDSCDVAGAEMIQDRQGEIDEHQHQQTSEMSLDSKILTKETGISKLTSFPVHPDSSDSCKEKLS